MSETVKTLTREDIIDALAYWRASSYERAEATLDAFLATQRPKRSRKPKTPEPPPEVFVMAFHTHNAVGSISHVGSGERFHLTKEACQKSIDEMKGWIGMGDRSKYRPIRLVSKEPE